MLRFPPSMLAAAAVFMLSALPMCPESGTQPGLLKMMVSFYQKAAVGKLTGVHRKYRTSKYDNAARCEPTSFLLEAWF
ncbi:hypothetical protein BC332_04785 [Capsicum chinense]|nr:hypothetical protein BC332_04785 [Capsicum chinense]